jgi:hypothetical protein
MRLKIICTVIIMLCSSKATWSAEDGALITSSPMTIFASQYRDMVFEISNHLEAKSYYALAGCCKIFYQHLLPQGVPPHRWLAKHIEKIAYRVPTDVKKTLLTLIKEIFDSTIKVRRPYSIFRDAVPFYTNLQFQYLAESLCIEPKPYTRSILKARNPDAPKPTQEFCDRNKIFSHLRSPETDISTFHFFYPAKVPIPYLTSLQPIPHLNLFESVFLPLFGLPLPKLESLTIPARNLLRKTSYLKNNYLPPSDLWLLDTPIAFFPNLHTITLSPLEDNALMIKYLEYCQHLPSLTTLKLIGIKYVAKNHNCFTAPHLTFKTLKHLIIKNIQIDLRKVCLPEYTQITSENSEIIFPASMGPLQLQIDSTNSPPAPEPTEEITSPTKRLKPN